MRARLRTLRGNLEHVGGTHIGNALEHRLCGEQELLSLYAAFERDAYVFMLRCSCVLFWAVIMDFETLERGALPGIQMFERWVASCETF